MPYKDPKKQKAAQHQHYLDNLDDYRNRTKKRRIVHKQRAIEYLGGKCIRCGYNRNWAALDLHHTNGDDKDLCISNIMHFSWVKILKELEKCILLCANCHREEHNPTKFFEAGS